MFKFDTSLTPMQYPMPLWKGNWKVGSCIIEYYDSQWSYYDHVDKIRGLRLRACADGTVLAGSVKRRLC